ncbi:DNA/RNA non-specific endonuclease, partial [Clostridium butyricum]
NDFYNNAGIVMENGSDKASNGAFDDDPQKGAAEAKATLEIMMNESALVAANEGANATLGILASDSSLVPTNNSSIPLEGKELEERSDIPDFDSFQEYDENQYVKKQMDDGTYVLGTAYRPDNKNVSIFTACDKEAVSEHTSLISELKSCGYGLLGAANRFIESMSEDQKKRDFEFQLIINKNASKYGIDCPSEYMGFETKGKTVDELMHEWKENNAEWRNNNLRNNAPCKYLYDGSEIAGDIVIPFLPIGKGPLMWCGTKKVSVAKSGIKVASELKNGKALTESEIIASSGIGNLKGTKGGAEAAEKVKYGEQYTKVNGKKALKSNVEYVTEEGYKYATDSSGRISTVEGSLDAGKAKRNAYAQRTVGKDNGRLNTDDGGHLIASIFKGSGELDNLVPMDATLNRGDWKTMESSWAKALDNGKTVDVKIEPIYSGTSQRPTSFKVKYKVDNGRWIKETFTN